MDLLVIALKALAAQQALQTTRNTARGGLMAAALAPVGIGIFLIGVGFLGYACYAVLLESLSPAAAALIVAVGMFLLTLCIALAMWLVFEGARNKPTPDMDLEPMLALFEKSADKMGDEIKKNPASSLMLAALAGAFVYVAFLDKR